MERQSNGYSLGPDPAAMNGQSFPALQNLQQATVVVRQLQMMQCESTRTTGHAAKLAGNVQSQTSARLRDLQTLAALPKHLQEMAAQRLNLGSQILQPQVLQANVQQLQQLCQQYQMQVVQVQMQQQRMQAQLQAQHAAVSAVNAASSMGGSMHGHSQHGSGHGPSEDGIHHQQRLGSLNATAVANNRYLAQHAVGAYTTGDRFRPTGNTRKKRRDDSPEPLHFVGSESMRPTRGSTRRKNKVNYAEAEAFADILDDEEVEVDSEDERQKLKQKNAVAAFDDTSELDDEVEKVLAHRDVEGMAKVPGDAYANKEFYVKWRHWSHIHNSWDTRETLMQLAGYKRVQNYIKRMEDLDRRRRVLTREEIELIDVERQMEYELSLQQQIIERIVAERTEKSGERKYLCKWQGLPYSESTWELVADVMEHGGKDQIDHYLLREQRMTTAPQSVEMARRMFLQRHRALQEQPAYLKGGELRDYQMQSLNWMIYSWLQNTNIILADEMGLGKTVQCSALLGYFSEVLNIFGPFLIVVPLSTVPNWIREFRKWIPNVNAVVYVGDTKAREVIREFEFFSKRRSDRELKFEALITTYELVLKDSEVLSQVRWNFLVVDEAHRLKNSDSALYKELSSWTFKNKLLVTGTPLQNSVKELWALLHFLDPYRFPSSEEFEIKYDLNRPESVSQLHADLKPHLLRRVIKDVEKSLPPKNERILRVDMTPLQRQYYKWILHRNFKELNKGGRSQVTLLNIISDLKKCCNHPFLFESAEDEYKGTDEASVIDRLVRTSGKMVLLDKLLKRLKPAGHRVLLFSQMVHMLDIISDYMRMKGWKHQRLDGSTPPQQRHQAMEQFNAEKSDDFAFLLSTRAGGLGINLATADTVIIFDSDWNPQNDLQAMSRAHRIGQKSLVNIYRFVTMGSVEQDILERAKRKMVLDHVIIQRMDTSGRTVLEGNKAGKDMFDKGELAAILRFGAENLFEEDAGEAKKEEFQNRDQALYEEDIDAILARAEVVDQRTEAENEEAKNELLSAFNMATFKNDEDDAAFWSRLLPEDTRSPFGGDKKRKGAPEDSELMPRTARLKATEAMGEPPRQKGRKSRSSRAPAENVQAITLTVSQFPQPCTEAREPVAVQWAAPTQISKRDAMVLVKAIRRCGRVERVPEAVADVPGLENAPPEAAYALWHALNQTCADAVAAAQAQDVEPKHAQVDFLGASVRALEHLEQINGMRIIHAEISQLADPFAMFRLDADTQTAPPKWAAANGWSPVDDSMLLLGCYLYGIGRWDRLAADERLGLREKLAGCVKDGLRVGDKTFPQGSHMETRVMSLLTRVERTRNPDAVSARPPRKPRRANGEGPAPKRARTERSAPPQQTLQQSACHTALRPVLSEMKKLRLLGKKSDIPEARVIAKTRKYLLAIGDHIVRMPPGTGEAPAAQQLWQHVSDFTNNECDGPKLRALYEKLDTKRVAADAEADELGADDEDGAVLDEDDVAAGGDADYDAALEPGPAWADPGAAQEDEDDLDDDGADKVEDYEDGADEDHEYDVAEEDT